MLKKRILSGLLVALLSLGLFTGCEESVSAEVSTLTALTDALSQVTSCETAISFEMQARIGTSTSSSGHSAAIASDITLESTFEPFSYHGEYYSYILVDGVRTREDKEIYVTAEDDDYILYEYDATADEWHRTTLTRAEALALPLRSGLVQDWNALFSKLRLDVSGASVNNRPVNIFTGEVSSSIIQELIGEKIFGSFLYSAEQLLNDNIPIELAIDTETYLPVQIVINFADEFIVNDMVFDSASIVVDYSNWNDYTKIDVPKKIAIVSNDPNQEFYSTYFAWNLFLPYINGTSTESGGSSTGNISFSASWETFQVRIDQGMTSLPLLYNDLYKLGYSLDDRYSRNILEPNSVMEKVPVLKGRDIIYCTIYNPHATPKPITECTIGGFDLSASDIPQNGISIYLPGEVTMGITKDSLLAAYGDPDVLTTGFSSDTYTWKGENENQSFVAEISPVNNQVIRISLNNVPILKTNTSEEDG